MPTDSSIVPDAALTSSVLSRRWQRCDARLFVGVSQPDALAVTDALAAMYAYHGYVIEPEGTTTPICKVLLFGVDQPPLYVASVAHQFTASVRNATAMIQGTAYLNVPNDLRDLASRAVQSLSQARHETDEAWAERLAQGFVAPD